MGEFPSHLNPALLLERAKATIVNDKVTSYFGFTVDYLLGPVPEDDYGDPILKKMPQYHRELHAYKQGGMGGHSKLYHMVNCIKLDLPDFEFVSRAIKIGNAANGKPIVERYINTETIRVLEACCNHLDLGIAGAASSGKTYPVAAFIIQDWKSAPNLTLSFVCTTSMAASEDRIWGAIVKQYQTSVHKVGTYIPHKSMIVWGKFSEEAQDREHSAAIKALAIPRGKEGQNAIDTTRGRKQVYGRLVFDELPEMELYVTKAAVNLESMVELLVIGIGNPMNHLDAHGSMCKPDHPKGFDSIDKETPEWKTRTGWCIFLNGEWSANFQAPENCDIPFPRLTNRRTLSKMLNRCHGNRESLEYYRNAIGFWPGSNIATTILTLELIEEKKCHEKVKWKSLKRTRICGFDTSFSSGGDLCVAQFGEVGEDITGRMVVQWLREKVYMVPANGVFEDLLAKQVVEDCIAFGVKPSCFGMDISSDGGKVMRSIIRYWLDKDRSAADVVPLSSMERPSERLVSNVDTRKCCDAFDRRVTEYWMMVREAVMCQNVRGLTIVNDNELPPMIAQLCTRTYSIKGRKFSIETKDDMKDRTLGVSPDHADAFCYMVEMARRHGLIMKSPEDDDREEERIERWEEERKTPSRDYNYDSDDWGERDQLYAA